MTALRSFLKSSILYLIGDVSSKLILFFLLPIYTKLITPEDFGYYDLSVVYVTVISSVIFLNIWSATLRFSFDGFSNKSILYSNAINILIVSVLIFLLLGSIIGYYTNIKYYYYIMLYGLFFSIKNFYIFSARGLRHNKLFALTGVINTFVTAGLNIILLLFFSFDFRALYLAACIGWLVQIVILEKYLKLIKYYSFSYYNKKLLKQILKYALPLCFNSVLFWFLSSYNRVAISNNLSVHENGIFAIAGKFALGIQLFASAFSMAWQELAFSKGEGNEVSKFYSTASNLYLKLLLSGILLLIPLFYIVFPFFVDPNYIESKELIPFYLLAIASSIFSDFCGNINAALKKTKIIFISTLCATTVNVVLIHILLNKIGVNGANISLFSAYLINILIRICYLKRNISLRLSLTPVIILFVFITLSFYCYLNFGLYANICSLIVAIFIILYFSKDFLFIILRKKSSIF